MGQDQDLYLAATNIVTSSENNAAEQVIDLGSITRTQADSQLLAGKIAQAVSQAKLRAGPRLQMLPISISGSLGRA